MAIYLREILKERNITLAAFSDMTGISQGNLSNILNRKISPTLETLERIATALELDVADLFRKDEEMEFMVKYLGKYYSITKGDIIRLIKDKYILPDSE